MPNPSPTIVRIDPRTRHVVATLIVVVVGGVVAGTALSLAGVIHNPHTPAQLAGMAALLTAAAGLLLLALFRNRLALYPDYVEVTNGLLPVRRIALRDIVGRRMAASAWRRPARHVLILDDGRALPLPPYLESSATLRDWLNHIPRR